MEDIYIIGTIVSFVVVIISIFKHFDSKFDRKIDNLHNKLDEFGREFRKQTIDIYKMMGKKNDTGNPISPEEKLRLIEKFENDTITKKEAKKLKQVLEEEKKEAEATGDSLAAIAIGLLLAALAYFLYKLMSGEEER